MQIRSLHAPASCYNALCCSILQLTAASRRWIRYFPSLPISLRMDLQTKAVITGHTTCLARFPAPPNHLWVLLEVTDLLGVLCVHFLVLMTMEAFAWHCGLHFGLHLLVTPQKWMCHSKFHLPKRIILTFQAFGMITSKLQLDTCT